MFLSIMMHYYSKYAPLKIFSYSGDLLLKRMIAYRNLTRTLLVFTSLKRTYFAFSISKIRPLSIVI